MLTRSATVSGCSTGGSPGRSLFSGKHISMPLPNMRLRELWRPRRCASETGTGGQSPDGHVSQRSLHLDPSCKHGENLFQSAGDVFGGGCCFGCRRRCGVLVWGPWRRKTGCITRPSCIKLCPRMPQACP